jgi:poly-beta-hydroxybutyrate-responsive repressor
MNNKKLPAGTEQGFSCHSPGDQIKGFVRPMLLLLIGQKPGYGYDLIERISKDQNIPDIDTGLLYRTMRQLEKDRLVTSKWDTTGDGPARRIYEITDKGIEQLHLWATNIRRTREKLGRFLVTYQTHFGVEKIDSSNDTK